MKPRADAGVLVNEDRPPITLYSCQYLIGPIDGNRQTTNP